MPKGMGYQKNKGKDYADTAQDKGKNKTPMMQGSAGTSYADTAKHKGKKPIMSPEGGYHT